MHCTGRNIDVLVNMFKIHFLIAACIAAVVAKTPPPCADLESAYNSAIETLEGIESESEFVKDIEEVKISLKHLFESINYQTGSSLSEAAEDTEERQYDANESSDIIDKLKKCLKKIMDEGKSKGEAIAEEFKKILNDIAKLKDCKGPKEVKEACIKGVISLIKQDINDLKNKSAAEIQWLINDVLPDFYQCIMAK
ncbi:unnamed protein product [Callosobruchus maculatus]|uniref:Saposin B-type domain-containing protein n=1 Tax=Callosobruchus maculatus TaxID=64391 RepID=A0A653BLC0_CALMS|nr:unnamed protein product [Callosobruchus maculatus]